MTEFNLSLCLYLSVQIRELIDKARRDGLANSLGHLNRIDETNQALYDTLMGQEPKLPI